MKTFTFCPQIALWRCQEWWPVPHRHIVIRTPGARLYQPACPGEPLYLEFHDLGENAEEKYRAGLFTEAQAQAIVAFLKGCPDDQLVVVNCEGGVSRSPGVVLALRRHYGGDTEEIFEKGVPNIFVTSILTRALRAQEVA